MPEKINWSFGRLCFGWTIMGWHEIHMTYVCAYVNWINSNVIEKIMLNLVVIPRSSTSPWNYGVVPYNIIPKRQRSVLHTYLDKRTMKIKNIENFIQP